MSGTIFRNIVLIVLIYGMFSCAGKKYKEDGAGNTSIRDSSISNKSKKISKDTFAQGRIIQAINNPENCTEILNVLENSQNAGDFIINTNGVSAENIYRLSASGAKILVDAGHFGFLTVVDIINYSPDSKNVMVIPTGLDNRRLKEILDMGVKLKYDSRFNPFDILYASDNGGQRVDILGRGMKKFWLIEYLYSGANVFLDDSFDYPVMSGIARAGGAKVKIFAAGLNQAEIKKLLNCGAKIILPLINSLSLNEIKMIAKEYPGNITLIADDLKLPALRDLDKENLRIMIRN